MALSFALWCRRKSSVCGVDVDVDVGVGNVVCVGCVFVLSGYSCSYSSVMCIICVESSVLYMPVHSGNILSNVLTWHEVIVFRVSSVRRSYVG